jgi:hypothetical protein
MICGSARSDERMVMWDNNLSVLRSEVPTAMEEEREYIRCRWAGIHGLRLKHSLKAAELFGSMACSDNVNKTGSLATERQSEGYGRTIISKVNIFKIVLILGGRMFLGIWDGSWF